MQIISRKTTLLLTLFALFACSKKDISYNYPNNPDYTRKGRVGSVLGGDFILYGEIPENKVSAAPLNLEDSKLWQTALKVVKESSSISSFDADGGMISTSWKLESEALRSKINVLIKGVEAKKENLQILIFWQKKQGANWINSGFADSSKGDLQALQIQEKILAKTK